MALNVTTTVTIGNIVQNIDKTLINTHNNLHQVNVVVPSGTTNYEIPLDITNTDNIRSLFITTSTPITYAFDTSGKGYNTLQDAILLVGQGSDAFQTLTELTGGTLVVDQQYYIFKLNSGDTFTSVGAAFDEAGVGFFAIAETPDDWSNGSTLITRSKTLDSIYVTNASNLNATLNVVIHLTTS
jgi:hypothetical protein